MPKKKGKSTSKPKSPELKRKFPSPDAGGKKRVFRSFKADSWKTKREAEWAADFATRFPEVKGTGPGGTFGITNEAIVKKDGSKYRLWIREKRRRRR